MSGDGNDEIDITVDVNARADARNTTVTVTTRGGVSKTITITQDAADSSLTLSPTSLAFNADGTVKSRVGMATIQLTSRVAWSVNSKPDCYCHPSSGGGGTQSVGISVSENLTKQDRSGEIRFYNEDGFYESLTVMQDRYNGIVLVYNGKLPIYDGAKIVFNGD